MKKLLTIGLLCALAVYGFAEGMTHLTSLTLTPRSDETYALVVNNTSGTAQFTITNAGVASFASSLAVTGAAVLSSTLNVGAITTTGVTSTGAILASGSTVAASSSTTTGFNMKMIGVYAALPTAGYSEGAMAYQTSDHKLYVATGTISAGSNSWVAVH